MEPYPAKGTCGDLLSILSRGELKRNHSFLPDKPGWKRALLEPVFNLVSGCLYIMASLTRPDAMLSVEDKVYRGLSGGEESPFDPASPALAQAAELIARARAETGKEPALLCLLSHPPALGELAYLNIELVRHSLWALRRLRGAPCRPKMAVAVDVFALDTQTLFREAMYSGFMGRYHVGIDRLWHSRGPIGRFLLRSSAWTSAAWRIRRMLEQGGELAMVLSGGIPTTGRIIYCVRECLADLRRLRPAGSPSDAMARLREQSPDFERFFRSGTVGKNMGRSAWRMMEAWVISTMAQGAPLEQVDKGEVPEASLRALNSVVEALGCPASAAKARLDSFVAEFARETPYRTRFFNFLSRRVVARGRAIVLLPLVHGREGAVRVEFKSPELLLPSPGPAARLCRDFVATRYD